MAMRRNGVIDMIDGRQQGQQRQQNDDLHRNAEVVSFAHVDAEHGAWRRRTCQRGSCGEYR